MSQIYLFTSFRHPLGEDPVSHSKGVTVVTSSAGCLVFPDGNPDTDVIYPGATLWQVRWLPGGNVASGTVTFAGKTHVLKFAPGIDFLGRPAAFWDSEWFEVNQAATINGGEAIVRICIEEPCEGENLDVRHYRTAA